MMPTLVLSFVLLSLCETFAQWQGTNPVYFNAGFVGIGTTNPTTDLHVANLSGGGIRIGSVGDVGTVAVPLGAQSAQHNLDFTGYRDVAPDQIGARISALRFNNYGTNTAYVQKTGLAFYTNPSGWSSGTADLVERIRITPEGNVGIGTSNPTETLSIAGTISLPLANGADNNSPGIVAVSDDDFLYGDQYINHYGFGFHNYNDGSGYDGTNTYLSGYYGIDAFTGGQSRLRINNNGNVGIGTTSPDSKLAVNGTIHSQEVKVDMDGWSDFVFDRDYNLLTLEEIKEFIDKNHHLPEIPSVAEVEQNGVMLGR